MNQLGFPCEVTVKELLREKSLGGAIDLCIKAAGFAPKEVVAELNGDKAQVSRWISGQEGVVWPKLEMLMDKMGNDAPLLWMVMRRGYDLSSLRRTESETERELRLAREQIAMLVHDKRVLVEALRGTA